jgi:hypothetical protein
MYADSVMRTWLQSYQQRFLQLTCLAMTSFLLYYYREGGVKDAGITNPGPRDVGVYISAGNAVLQGINPYELVGNRFGAVGAVPFGVIDFFIPSNLTTVFFQVVNLAGIFLFIRTFQKAPDNFRSEVIYLLIILFSATREMLVTNQITGILMGIFAFWHRRQGMYLASNKKIHLLIASLSAVFLLDLKPHLFGLILLFYFIKSKEKMLPITISATWIFLHLLVDLTQRRILEIDWFNTLFKLQEQAKGGQLPDAVSFWPLINSFFPGIEFSSLTIFFPLILGLLALGFLSRKRNILDLLPWLFLLPATSIYFHYYDLIPALVLMMIMQIQSPSKYFVFAICYLTIPQEYLEPRNAILILIGLIAWVVFVKQTSSIRALILSGLALAFSYMAVKHFSEDPRLVQSWIVTESVLIATYFLKPRFKLA